jgi:hypothetical protein
MSAVCSQFWTVVWTFDSDYYCFQRGWNDSNHGLLKEMKCHQGVNIDIGGFSGESWSPKADAHALAGILSAIEFGSSTQQNRLVLQLSIIVQKLESS